MGKNDSINQRNCFNYITANDFYPEWNPLYFQLSSSDNGCTYADNWCNDVHSSPVAIIKDEYYLILFSKLINISHTFFTLETK